jgi:hypothetical protein
MTNPAAAIPLTVGGTDVQQNPIGIFLEIVRGLSETAEVRGVDTLVPGLAGRIARNRLGDTRRLLLEGLVAGTGNEIETVAITGSPAGGTFTLTFQGQTTAGIAWNATAATIQTALEALSNIAPGDVVVTGGPMPGTVRVYFGGAYAATDVTQMTGSAAGLTGGTPVLTVATLTNGGATEAAQRSSFWALVAIIRSTFDPTQNPVSVVAALPNGTTATILARTLATILWDQRLPSLAKVSIEMESVAPNWTIV